MFDHSIFGRGRLTYDSFRVNPTVPLTQQVNELTEDLLQVVYENDVVLDAGWYPEFSPDGHFRVVVVTDSNWEQPWFDRRCSDLQQLMEVIHVGVKVAEWLASNDDMLLLTLYPDNNPEVPTPTWRQLLEALLAMDGLEKTLTCLEAPAGPTLMIGGGNDGRFLVDYLVDARTQQNYVLTDLAASGPEAELCCGGQSAGYPAHWCVGFGLVLEAARYFCRTGEMAPQLSWEEGR